MTLPDHAIDISPLPPRTGGRVQIDAANDIDRDEASALIAEYYSMGAPDGQIVVRKASKFGGAMAPFAVENFDDRGVVFNETFF